MNGRRAKALRRAADREAGPGAKKVAYRYMGHDRAGAQARTIRLRPDCWRAIYQRLKRAQATS